MQRTTSMILLATLATMSLATGCASSGQRAAGKASPTALAAFAELKTLKGDWEMTDEKGRRSVAAVFSVTSAGSAVREIMFPGTPDEMTNMYHLDGDSIVATHYCAAGNQPRLRYAPVISSTSFAFNFADITNLASADTEHMADLTLTIKDANHITETWMSRKKNVKTEHVVFELVRKN